MCATAQTGSSVHLTLAHFAVGEIDAVRSNGFEPIHGRVIPMTEYQRDSFELVASWGLVGDAISCWDALTEAPTI